MTLLILTILLTTLVVGICLFGVLLLVWALCRAASQPVPTPFDKRTEEGGQGCP